MYLRFPQTQLPDGRYMRIEMMTQTYAPTPAPPDDSAVMRADVDFNPFLVDGLPAPVREAQPQAGMMGGESADFKFLNIPISAMTGQTLYDVMVQIDVSMHVWMIRYYISPVSNTFGARPDFWGIVDVAEKDGTQLWFDDDATITCGFTARNRIALLEKISITLWINGPNGNDGYLLHSLYDKAPANGIFVDGMALHHYFHDDNGSPRQDRDWPTLRFFRLLDIVQSASNAIGVTGAVNGTGTLNSSWEFQGSLTSAMHTADDLAVISRTEINTSGGVVYQHEFTFWDDKSNTNVSVFKLANVAEALKAFLVPLGLVCSIEYLPDGTSYMDVREAQCQYGMAAYRAIEGVQYEPAEQAAYGMSVKTSDHSEIASGDSSDQAIQNPYISASRLRTRLTWSTRDVDDLIGLYQSLWIWIPASGGTIDSVTNVSVHADGLGLAQHTLSFNAHDPIGMGNRIAEAAASYWFNRHEDESDSGTTAPIGVYRRYKQQMTYSEQHALTDVYGTASGLFGQPRITCSGAFPEPADAYVGRELWNATTGARTRVTGKVDNGTLATAQAIFNTGNLFVLFMPRPGDYKIVGGRKWRIVSVAPSYEWCTTEYKLERGYTDA